MNHIRLFINQVETEYSRFYYKTGCGAIRPVSMFLVHRLNGLTARSISKYFRISETGACVSIRRQRGYFESLDEKFISTYNDLLEIYIRVTKVALKK